MFHRYDIIDEQDLNNSIAKLAAALTPNIIEEGT